MAIALYSSLSQILVNLATKMQNSKLLCLNILWAILGIIISCSPALSLERVTSKVVGKLKDGRPIHEYTLKNKNDLEARVLTYGATLTRVRMPDKNGKIDDIALYLDTAEEYVKGHPLFGSVVGRYANRISNARFKIDGKVYEIEKNAGKNHIHGGRDGFQKRLWTGKGTSIKGSASVSLKLTSPDGDAGYPGELKVEVIYTLNDDNELKMRYKATTTKATHLNLTNHAYWNLGGAGSGDVLGHILNFPASKVLEADQHRYPTGKILKVDGTPLDFRKAHSIGSRIKEAKGENYDDCYVVDRRAIKSRLQFIATVYHRKSGRWMDVLTTQPGFQLYTAKGLSSRWKTKDRTYGPYHGFCLETQNFPDAPNHANFPSSLLRPGEVYDHETIHRFKINKKTGSARS